MKVVKYISIIAIALSMAGCASRPVDTTAIVTVEKTPLIIPNTDRIKLKDLDWQIISKDAAPGSDGHIDTAFKNSGSDSLFALSSRGYENLSINTAELIKSIKQLQAQVKAYKDYYQKEPEKTREVTDAKR